MDIPSIRGNQNTTKLIQYLKNSEEQYPALNYEEERAVIEANKNKRSELERLLYMHNIKLVFSTVKHWKHKVNEYDEVIQDTLEGLGEACHRFDPWKQARDPKTKEPLFMPDGSPRYVKFTTYAMPWINKKILERFYKKNVAVEQNSISLNTPTSLTTSKSDGRDTATLEDYIQEYVDPLEWKNNSVSYTLSSAEQLKICKDLYGMLEQDTSLSVTERAIFTDMFYNGASRELLVRKYRVTKNAVDNLRNKILKKFKGVLENEYHIHSYSDIYSE